jgi:hypothetical protein
VNKEYLLINCLHLAAFSLHFIDMIRPNSRPKALANLDGRTKEAAFVRKVRAELVAHVGGSPSVTKRALIDAAVQIRLRLAVMDAEFAQTKTFTEHTSRQYLAWSGHYARMLKQLGMDAPSEKPPSLAEILAQRSAAA